MEDFNPVSLRKYFKDLETLFLKKFRKFCSGKYYDDAKIEELLTLVKELGYVKSLFDTSS